MEVPASGREAEVFALDDRRVVRRFRDPSRSAGSTVALLERLTRLGYPVPAVLSWDGHELVQERVHGPRMDEALLGGDLEPVQAGLMLAGLLDRLHALPWGDEPLLHLDLHPQNVLLGHDGPVYVDRAETLRRSDPNLSVLELAQLSRATDLVREWC